MLRKSTYMGRLMHDFCEQLYILMVMSGSSGRGSGCEAASRAMAGKGVCKREVCTSMGMSDGEGGGSARP